MVRSWISQSAMDGLCHFFWCFFRSRGLPYVRPSLLDGRRRQRHAYPHPAWRRPLALGYARHLWRDLYRARVQPSLGRPPTCPPLSGGRPTSASGQPAGGGGGTSRFFFPLLTSPTSPSPLPRTGALPARPDTRRGWPLRRPPPSLRWETLERDLTLTSSRGNCCSSSVY